MGWLVYDKPHGSLKAHMDEKFTFCTVPNQTVKYTVLASALVNMREYYAAVEIVQPEGHREVVAVICELSIGKNRFGYKDMDETMGPYYYNCPASVMKHLTPTTDENSVAWRAKVNAVLAQKERAKAVKHGDTIQFEHVLHFLGGRLKLDTFTVEKKGSKVVFIVNGQRFRITGWRKRSFIIIDKEGYAS